MSRKCPNCNSAKQVIPILYGEPTEESFQKLEEGKLFLGGCLIDDFSPSHACKTCRIQFDKKDHISQLEDVDKN